MSDVLQRLYRVIPDGMPRLGELPSLEGSCGGKFVAVSKRIDPTLLDHRVVFEHLEKP
ncbi:MAG TPA: hypothetical protein VF376_11100 [Thermoanaerobaculia bacterium]